MDYARVPDYVIEDVVRLRRRLDRSQIPPRRTDDNLIVGTWNIRDFGGLYPEWGENAGSPKRNLRGLVLIAEIIRRFDVIALQEVKRNTTALRYLMADLLGPHWGVMLTDVTAGAKGNVERLAYLYDTRRATPSGLSGQIVLPPTAGGDPQEQFDRTPYMVGFRAAQEQFTLLTAHIRYGNAPHDRLPELQRFAKHTAGEIRDRVRTGSSSEEPNLIVLGDFNIDKRLGNPLFDAFIETGLWVPEALHDVRTTYGTEAKHYDQIAWFRDDFELMPTGAAGKIDFADAVFQELTRFQMTFRVSDHFPLWVEFSIDRSEGRMAIGLGIDPNQPDPFREVPD